MGLRKRTAGRTRGWLGPSHGYGVKISVVCTGLIRVISGRLRGKRRAAGFPEKGEPNEQKLCPPAAAISSARFNILPAHPSANHGHFLACGGFRAARPGREHAFPFPANAPPAGTHDPPVYTSSTLGQRSLCCVLSGTNSARMPSRLADQCNGQHTRPRTQSACTGYTSSDEGCITAAAGGFPRMPPECPADWAGNTVAFHTLFFPPGPDSPVMRLTGNLTPQFFTAASTRSRLPARRIPAAIHPQKRAAAGEKTIHN